VHGDTIDRFAMVGKAFFDPPVRQQRLAVRPMPDAGARRTLFLAGARGINHDGLVTALDNELGRTHEGSLAAHADQWRIQRMVGDQPQRAAGAEHVGPLVALESEGVATAHGNALTQRSFTRLSMTSPPRRSAGPRAYP
jgi:hypothetical protein